MIDFTTARPLQDAVSRLGKRTPLAVALSSAELADLPVEIREVSFFSANVESERILAAMQARILQRVRLERENLSEDGVIMNRSRFIEEMQDELEAMGYQPKPSDQGTIRDLSSAGRLGLIWDMNLDMARGYANWKTSMNPDLLEAVPAFELIRLEERFEKRDWVQIWKDHGGQFYGEPSADFPGAPGRMIALATDPIWQRISEFGVPWPPFRWGSGVGKGPVRWREAKALGIPGFDQPQTPQDLDFTAGTKASIKGLPAPAIDRLRSTFGDTAKMEDGSMTFSPPKGTTVEESLRDRSEAVARTAQDAGEDRPEVIAPVAAVSTGRKPLAVFPEDEPTIVDWLDDSMQSAVIDGRRVVWRPDLIASAVVQALTENELASLGGFLSLGAKLILTGPGNRVIEFIIPHARKRTEALIRLRDMMLAIGGDWKAVVDGKEVKP